jgi:hypothetical protein
MRKVLRTILAPASQEMERKKEREAHTHSLQAASLAKT